MGLVKLKPNTPGQRFKVAATFEDVTKSTPEKSLIRKAKKYPVAGGGNLGILGLPDREYQME